MKKHIITIVISLLSLSALAQGFIDVRIEDSGAEMRTIEKRWTTNAIRVNIAHPKALIHDLAQAFCGQYTNYVPNSCAVKFLKNPSAHDPEKNGYHAEVAPRNGFMRCDIGAQFDHKVEMCYWRRPNGHSLVGVLMLAAGEGERSFSSLLFYDYDPATHIMTPDVKVCNTVNGILSKHKGSRFMSLPKEGKDIRVSTVEWSETDDFVYDEFMLK